MLIAAAKKGNAQMVQALLAAGVKVTPMSSARKATELHVVTSVDALRALVRAGAALEHLDEEGRTPLQATLHNYHNASIDVAVALVQAGANVKVVDKDGNGLLAHTGWRGMLASHLVLANAPLPKEPEAVSNLLSMLFHGLGHEAKSTADKSLVRQALKRVLASAKRISNQGDHIARAIGTGDITLVLDLVEAGMSMAARPSRYASVPLDIAVQKSTAMLAAVLALGMPANTVDGTIALSTAVSLGDTVKVRMLLDAGAPVKRSSVSQDEHPHHHSPLEMAVIAETLNHDIVAALLSAGADPNEILEPGEPLLHRALVRGTTDAAKVLLAAGARTEVKGPHGRTTLMVAAACGAVEVVDALLKRGEDVNRKDKRGWTAVTFALAGGRVAALQRLLQAGAVASTWRDNLGRTLAHYACPGSVRLLAAAGVPLDVADKQGCTPVFVAAARGSNTSTDVIRELVGAGVDPNERTKVGVAPLQEALARGHLATVAALIQCGATAAVRAEEPGSKKGARGAASSIAALPANARSFPLTVAVDVHHDFKVVLLLASAPFDAAARAHPGYDYAAAVAAAMAHEAARRRGIANAAPAPTTAITAADVAVSARAQAVAFAFDCAVRFGAWHRRRAAVVSCVLDLYDPPVPPRMVGVMVGTKRGAASTTTAPHAKRAHRVVADRDE